MGGTFYMQRRFLDCVKTAAFPRTSEEKKWLLHMVRLPLTLVSLSFSCSFVLSNPTLSIASHHDLPMRFFADGEDLKNWYPELQPYMRLTLVEALPSVLPMLSNFQRYSMYLAMIIVDAVSPFCAKGICDAKAWYFTDWRSSAAHGTSSMTRVEKYDPAKEED
ncbi:hypothetical protein HYDPIDRAFT_30480 [Hydnomerulius pinastri MD-312]|uniref:Uncharacterized protein n=1 Tax=Hydnomerulius pinastri MD-312 TaxID=994086 RepID=A0A0C9V977_9AGAM|nr:hypothetical protein HYDPIDRAFT_30480 [Hydnomerulius pinastri MD-312]